MASAIDEPITISLFHDEDAEEFLQGPGGDDPDSEGDNDFEYDHSVLSSDEIGQSK